MNNTHDGLLARLLRRVSSRYASSVLLFAEGWLVAMAVRLLLVCFKGSELFSQPLTLLAAFALGALTDLTAVSAIILLQSLPLTAASDRFLNSNRGRCMTFVLCVLCQFVFFFSAVAEVLFWHEFESRFNFIAVDYLAYTTEVVANIMQSYPVIPIILVTLALAGGGSWVIWRKLKQLPQAKTSPMQKLTVAGGLLLVILVTMPVSLSVIPALFENDKYGQELSKNGLCSLAQAFFQNQLDYEQFYRTLPLEEMGRVLRKELSDDPRAFLSESPLDIRRSVTAQGAERKWNVIIVLEESLSASFIGALDAAIGKSLTPQFDDLCNKGVLLEKCFASGTRTVRGIEAVALSIPPTPGQSIVKRPANHGLFSMGTVFREKGYQCTFIYGGNGFFDNMNDFFEDNDYRILDCNAEEANPQTFSNAWGCCDEDIFQWSLADADHLHNAGTPFHQFILTTSNHRPYTFPENAINAPQGHRSSAVNYSDYALGKYLRDAEQHSWFENTLFVIIADHCHSTSGRSVLALNKYHIPALFYAPRHLQPKRISTVCSQIDIAPTIFGLLNWSYTSEFFGKDIRQLDNISGTAFPGTFQNLGFLNGATGRLTTLLVKGHLVASQWETQMPFTETPCEPDDDDARRSIAIYQAASIRLAKRLDLTFRKETPHAQPTETK